MEAKTQKPDLLRLVRDFFVKNPWWGAAASLATVIAIPLAIYLAWLTIEAPEVTIFVDPNRSALVQAGKNSDLSVFYKGGHVGGDISSVTVSLWNAGKRPVLPSDVLVPLKLSTAHNSRILEAKIRGYSRDAIDFKLDDSDLAQGVVGIGFKALEKNDGAEIQLIYEGDASVAIKLDGAIIGQRALSMISVPGAASDRAIGSEVAIKTILKLSYWFITVLFLLQAALTIFMIKTGFSGRNRKLYLQGLSVLLLCAVVLGGLAWDTFTTSLPTPRFDAGRPESIVLSK